MKPATPQQKKAINAILAKRGLMDTKAGMISEATAGRTTHSKELYFYEAANILKALNASVKTPSKPSDKMKGKLFAMAYEIGWIKENAKVGKNGLEVKKDYTRLHQWITKYGYLHKPLDQYTYNEIPKLVTQYEFGPYSDYFKNL